MVKPSRYKTVVKRHHVRRREFQVLVGTIVAALVLGAGFYLGQRAAYSGMGIDPEVYRELREREPAIAQRFNELERELEVNRTRHEVDRAALEMVRKEIATEKEQTLALEESLRFYQGLMAPEDIARGLVLRPVELVGAPTDSRIFFRITVLQEARKHALMRGTLDVRVLGEVDGKTLSFALSALSEDVESESISLRFRYFQVIEGELVVPPGFEPRAVSLSATTTAPGKNTISEQQPWSLQERFSHVGK